MSLKYFMITEEKEKVEVCKKMFMSTLGLKTDGQITEYKKACSMDGMPRTTDLRSKREPKNKLDLARKTEVIEHIESYRPQVSHYKLCNAPNRRYLDMNLTVKDMHENYNSSHERRISYELYRKIFEAQNIGHSGPSQDECPTCILGKSHEHDNASDPDTAATERRNCSICMRTELHQQMAKEAREEYQRDSRKEWDTGSACFAVDMQKIIMLPKMNVKEHFFVSRLAVFNETFASLSNDDDLCVLWHEGLSGRDASDVTSAYYKIISKLTNVDKFLFWADNCSAQNKNWTLFSGLSSIVNSPSGPQEIRIKYFEPGHTFMRADSVHGSIGKAMRREEQILDWEDFTKLVNSSSTKSTVVELTEFYKVDDYHRQPTKKFPIPLLKDVREAKFEKGSTLLQYKTRISEVAYRSAEFMKVKARSKPETLWTGRKRDIRGLQIEKKNVILDKLVPLMPIRKREFWKKMIANDSVVDLVTSRDPGEEV